MNTLLGVLIAIIFISIAVAAFVYIGRGFAKDIKSNQSSQKTSPGAIVVLMVFIAIIIAVFYIFEGLGSH
jgi:Na+/H+ antiporter NhaC